MGCSAQQIRRNGAAGDCQEWHTLHCLYGITGAERDRLLELAREADQPGWWETARPDLPSQLTALVGFESQATRMTNVAMLLVPGLLQTPEYARAVMASSGVATPNAETRVATRMGRQVILSRPEPPELLAIVDEAVLRRPMGGRKIMADQLRHMVRVSERPNVTLRVIPFEFGGHIGVNGPYVVLEFAKADTIVHMEHLRSGVFVDEPKDVEPFLIATATLTETALEPAASEKLLLKVADEYEQ